MNRKFGPIYLIDSKGKTREWFSEIHKNHTHSDIVVTTGIKDGKMVSQLTTIREGKNIGKSNETNHFEQAVSEAQSAYEKQLKKGYVINIEDAQQGVKGSGCPSPMLAKTYDPRKQQSGSNDLKGYKLEGETVVVQPKLDGVRRLFIMDNYNGVSELKSYTRGGDEVPVMEHMKHDIIKFIVDNDLYGRYLDGELYCDPSLMSFQELNGLTRKSDGDPERLKLIKYHIYDIISDKGYQERFMCDWSYPRGDSIEIVPYLMLTAKEEIIDLLHNDYVNQGYEGIMIRTLNMPYENKRSKSLLKYKAFEDAEFLCTGVELDKEGRIGAITVVEGDKTFSPAVVGTDEYKKWLVDNSDSVIGKKVTVNFFGRSVEGIPRFPRFVSVRYDI